MIPALENAGEGAGEELIQGGAPQASLWSLGLQCHRQDPGQQWPQKLCRAEAAWMMQRPGS